jgi:hypothetical protein
VYQHLFVPSYVPMTPVYTVPTGPKCRLFGY